MNVHIDMDQPVQSEPRLRLVLAENLLRDINNIIQRMEVRVCQIYLNVMMDFQHSFTFFETIISSSCLPVSESASRCVFTNRFCCCDGCCCCAPSPFIIIHQLHPLSLCSAHGHFPTSNNASAPTHLFRAAWGTNTAACAPVRRPSLPTLWTVVVDKIKTIQSMVNVFIYSVTPAQLSWQRCCLNWGGWRRDCSHTSRGLTPSWRQPPLQNTTIIQYGFEPVEVVF